MSKPEDSEDRAWLEIVENYGERPELEVEETPPPAAAEAGYFDDDPSSLDDVADEVPESESFVPPTPPRVPRPPLPKLIAWVATLGSPVLALLLAMLPVEVPSWGLLLLALAFIGGFCYLVATMRRTNQDGWDDGAVV